MELRYWYQENDMKIAFLNIYQDKANRGVETFVFELSKRLKKNNIVDIISGGDINVPPWHKSFLWRAFLDPNSLAIAWFTLKKVPKIWKEKYNVVIPVNGGWQPAILRIITWLYGGKMIISGQSGIGWHERNNLWCLPNAFVALSSNAEKWAKKAGPFTHVVKISNGVDLDRFTFKGESFKAWLGKPIVLAVGAFTEQKRMDLVIKAVAKMKKASLLMVGGGGGLKEKLNEEGKRLLGGRFELICVPFGKMPEVYRAADVFTLPSAPSEAFGNVLVEAMASGVPVVATNDPIRKEIVGDAGILVNPTDENAYADALGEALKKNWGDKPRKQAEKFSWDEIAKSYENLLQRFSDKS